MKREFFYFTAFAFMFFFITILPEWMLMTDLGLGTMPCILCISIGTIAVAFYIGLTSAVYFSEHACPVLLVRLAKLVISILTHMYSRLIFSILRVNK